MSETELFFDSGLDGTQTAHFHALMFLSLLLRRPWVVPRGTDPELQALTGRALSIKLGVEEVRLSLSFVG